MKNITGKFKTVVGILQEMLYAFLLIGIGCFIALGFAR